MVETDINTVEVPRITCVSVGAATHTPPPIKMKDQLSIEGHVEISQERQIEKAILGGQG